MTIHSSDRQRALSLVVEVRAGDQQPLEAVLTELGGNGSSCTSDQLRFTQIPTLHFARVVLVPESADGLLPAVLVLGAYYDGEEGAHLDCLVRECGSGLRSIFRHCPGFPADASDAQLRAYMVAHLVTPPVFYTGARQRPLHLIQAEADLRTAIAGFLATRSWAGEPPAVVRTAIQAFVAGQPNLSWAIAPELLGGVPEWLRRIGAMGLLLLRAIPLLLWVLPYIRFAEEREKTAPVRPTNPVSEGLLLAREDYGMQNQLSHLSTVKAGLFRRVTLRLVLRAVEVLSNHIYIRGNLANIQTIHFARFLELNGGRRLLFFSDFDRSWDSYLSEFVDRAFRGLTGIWSNTEGFPPARWLIYDGARDEQGFKQWTRQSQIITQVWYRAPLYEGLTIQNVLNNTRLRQGLTGEMDAASVTQWLRLL